MSLLETVPLLEKVPLRRDRALMVHVSMGSGIEETKPTRGIFVLGYTHDGTARRELIRSRSLRV